jgi:hypothetical protein
MPCFFYAIRFIDIRSNEQEHSIPLGEPVMKQAGEAWDDG